MADLVAYDASFPSQGSLSIERNIPDSPARIRLAQFSLSGMTQSVDFVACVYSSFSP